MARTRRRAWRGGVLLVAVSITAVTLTGCASWGLSQRGWASDIARIDGVESVDWNYDSGFLTTGPRYDSDILVSADLTETQARNIAEASCMTRTSMDRVYVTTDVHGVGAAPVEMTLEDAACLDPGALLAFARTAAASRALGSDFSGGLTVYWNSEDGDDAAEGFDPVRINVAAPEHTMLLDALRELDAHSRDQPLSFTSSVTGSLSAAPGITAELDPEDDLAPMLPVLQAALDVSHGEILTTGGAVTVELLTTAADASDSVAELRRIANDSDVALTTPFPRIDRNVAPARETALIDAIVSVPGGATVVFPGGGVGSEIEVRTVDFEGTATAARTLALAGELRASFRVHGPDPERFWVAIRPLADPPDSFDEALTTAMTAERELAEVDRVILDLTRGTVDLTVIMENSTSRDAAADAQRLLQAAASSGYFDEVRLRTPWTEFDAEVIG